MPKLDEKRLHALETLVRDGRAGRAREALSRLTRSDVPRPHAAHAAQLAWRAGLPHVGIRLLAPFVRPKPTAPAEATVPEKAEYAQCLMRLGATAEAMTLLRGMDAGVYPRVSLYTAAIHCSRWAYGEALPHFLSYVRATSLESYEGLVARVNLAAALIYEKRRREAGEAIRELMFHTKARKLMLLYGNVLEIAAQDFIRRRDFSRAREYLSQAESALRDAGTLDAFFVEKWKAVLGLAERPEDPKALGDIRAVSAAAIERGDWETRRECDRHVALHRRDASLVVHLWYGTPYPAYRERLGDDWGERLELPASYEWKLGTGGEAACVDVAGGRRIGGGSLPAGKTLHRLLSVLTADFYRPFRIAELFSELCPDEFYNLASSPKRVHQSIASLREWFAEQNLPLAIEERDQAYFLTAHAAVRLRLAAGTSKPDRHSLYLARLRDKWPESEFALSEASAWLDISDRSALRVLEKAMREGAVTRLGKRAFTRYQFVKKAG